MRRLVLIFLISLLCASNNIFSTNVRTPEPPYGLITPTYGIVTPDDLAYDLERRDIHPYDPNAFTASLYWQCLPKKDVKFTYETWRGTDGMGAWDEIVTMCAFEIAVKQGNERQGYIGRRGLPVEHCQDLQDEWEKLTKGEDIVCLNGEGGAYHTKKDTTKKYKLWTWEKTKTSKGCGSFFYGICNTAGCAKGTCPL